MAAFFTTILYQPLWNALVFLYNIIPGHDLGVAIIALTVLIKLITLPFSIQALNSQRSMQALQPKLDALKKQFGADRDGLAKATMALYAEEKVSPFSSCLPLLVQFPILIALYQVLRAGLGHPSPELLYPFVANPGTMNPKMFGAFDLSVPSYVLAVVAGAVQFVQAKMMMVKSPPPAVAASPAGKDESTMSMVNKQMLYLMPVMTVIIGIRLPGGLALYWLTTNILTVIQQYFVLRAKK